MIQHILHRAGPVQFQLEMKQSVNCIGTAGSDASKQELPQDDNLQFSCCRHRHQLQKCIVFWTAKMHMHLCMSAISFRHCLSAVQDLRKRLLEMQTQGHEFDPMGWPTKMLKTEPK